MHENFPAERETALLAAVDTGEYDAEASLLELEELAKTAEIDSAGYLIQNRKSMDTATCLGSGKLLELRDLAAAHEASLVIFDHELSGVQLRNIEEACGVAVIDRTMLILDIFARHAHSSEGRLQVELAQSRYLLPRLAGIGKNLSRLGGGGGGAGAGARRGAGETKLELDRRHIRRRITRLEESLEDLSRRRGLLRDKRKRDGITTVAIVGYTNVGKSTLLNALTDAGVLVEDKLFATLDPTARALELPDGRSVMLIDTVGLVRRLPHHLVRAFHSTLEEALYADLLLNVCDISSPDAAEQIEVTRQILNDLGAGGTPVLTVLNKCDKISDLPPPGDNTAIISAVTGCGLSELLEKTAQMLDPTQRRMSLLIPYEHGAFIGEIRRDGKVLYENYAENGIEIDAMVDRKVIHKVRQFEISRRN
jgi:GTP-binding protein HflX